MTSTSLNNHHKLTSSKKKNRDFRLSFRTNNVAVNRMVPSAGLQRWWYNTEWHGEIICTVMTWGDCWFVEVTENILDIKEYQQVQNLFSTFSYPKWQSTHQIYNHDLRTKVKEPPKPQLHSMADKIHCSCPLDWVLPCHSQHRTSCTVQGYSTPKPCAEKLIRCLFRETEQTQSSTLINERAHQRELLR